MGSLGVPVRDHLEQVDECEMYMGWGSGLNQKEQAS